MALGATAGDVRSLALRQAATVTGVGVMLGLASALLLGRMMSSAMVGIIALDASLFFGFSAAIAIVSFAAAYLPAQRSSRIDPATILRGR
jgi:ABC-type antimicrobial peptide transport system permease subunit